MKVVAYNIKDYEKELLAKANNKIHDLTLISNGLSFGTFQYAVGKDAILVSEQDLLDFHVLDELYRIGVKHIVTRSVAINHIDVEYAKKLKLHVANTPVVDLSPKNIAEQVILTLNSWSAQKCVGEACQCKVECSNKKMKN